jgi:hypothetical protein
MSLVHKPEMTEANLAAHRANGSMSQGTVTPEGKARVAAANLRHGFYAQASNGALASLGEDPAKACRSTALSGQERGTDAKRCQK